MALAPGVQKEHSKYIAVSDTVLFLDQIDFYWQIPLLMISLSCGWKGSFKIPGETWILNLRDVLIKLDGIEHVQSLVIPPWTIGDP